LAGALLTEGFEHHERRERREERREEEAAYDQGQSGFMMSNFLLYNENESDYAL
jgi:hypothetical protein